MIDRPEPGTTELGNGEQVYLVPVVEIDGEDASAQFGECAHHVVGAMRHRGDADPNAAARRIFELLRDVGFMCER